YWAPRDGEPLVVVPLVKDVGAARIAFRITMGVRNGDDAWKRKLNEVIRKRQGDIDKVLLEYGVPLLVDDDTSTEMVTKPPPSASGEPAPSDATAAKAPTSAATPTP